MINILIWLIFGLGGYFLILHAYKLLEGYETPRRKLQQLPAITIGPFAVILGLFQLWDVWTDPPKRS